MVYKMVRIVQDNRRPSWLIGPHSACKIDAFTGAMSLVVLDAYRLETFNDRAGDIGFEENAQKLSGGINYMYRQ
jgi:hypothetical protein